MSPQETAERLREIRMELHQMPHIDCGVVEVVEGMESGTCSCYKRFLHASLLEAEQAIRETLGLDPF